MNKKEIFNKYRSVIGIVLKVKNIFAVKKKIYGKNNKITGLDSVMAKKCLITISGSNNVIEFGEMSQIYGVSISIYGDNNRITIGKLNYLSYCAFALEDSNNQILTGDHTYIYNNTELAAMEGTKIVMGEDCLISSDVVIRTGDSHRIESINDHKRINFSKDIILGRHVWVGKRAMLMKGTAVKDGCIVAAGGLVTSSSKFDKNTVIGGNPASVLKENCTWQHLRG